MVSIWTREIQTIWTNISRFCGMTFLENRKELDPMTVPGERATNVFMEQGKYEYCDTETSIFILLLLGLVAISYWLRYLHHVWRFLQP